MFLPITQGGGVRSITGTANQVITSQPRGSVTLSLPQDIATTSSPTFGGLTLSSTTVSETITATNTTGNAVLVLNTSGAVGGSSGNSETRFTENNTIVGRLLCAVGNATGSRYFGFIAT